MSKPHPEKLLDAIKIRDPLGEISARAKELWQLAGSPADKGWQLFLEEAEADLTLGRGRSSSTHETSDNGLPQLIAKLFTRPLTEHEFLCLVRILRTHYIFLGGGQTSLHPKSLEEALTMVVELTDDYPTTFLAESAVKNYLEIPVSQRIDYWKDIILKLEQEDAPLTAADRNTLHRLYTLLASQPSISNITNQEI